MAYLAKLLLFPSGDPSSDSAHVLDHPNQLTELPKDMVESCPLAVATLDTGERYAIQASKNGYAIEGPLDDQPLFRALQRQSEKTIRSATLNEAVQNILFLTDLDRFMPSTSRN